ncbi:MAG TPA: hypothetical protein VLA34_04940 [Candidatus Krumholzibacterium sp.]|nr:hypothetical protein [Candidatus Krumholzibacterium sp.]
MKACTVLPVVLILVIVLSGECAATAGEAPDPAGKEYLGQSVPGRVPEVFAPGVISDAGYRLHGPVAISPDGRQVCWSVIPPAVMYTSLKDGVWSKPEPMPIPGRGIQAPAFSKDGSRLYYQAVMEDSLGSVDIWWVERTAEGWGEPVNAGPSVNTGALESQPCPTSDGTLYYTGTIEDVGFNRGIYRSRPAGGGYGPAEPLGSGINTEYIDYCPWIAPDESYLIFASSRPRTEEPLYLHISFLKPDGTWSTPQNIHAAIGFEEPARFPSVSSDGRFLFFVSGSRVYWVDIAGVLELKPE